MCLQYPEGGNGTKPVARSIENIQIQDGHVQNNPTRITPFDPLKLQESHCEYW